MEIRLSVLVAVTNPSQQPQCWSNGSVVKSTGSEIQSLIPGNHIDGLYWDLIASSGMQVYIQIEHSNIK